jgi:hypothetical protein
MTGTTPGALIGHDLFHCAVILKGGSALSLF